MNQSTLSPVSSSSSSASSSSESEWSDLSDFSTDEAVIAFQSALEAEFAACHNLEEAVRSLFGPNIDDRVISPIISALRMHKELHKDNKLLASLCHAVYSLIDDDDDIRAMKHIQMMNSRYSLTSAGSLKRLQPCDISPSDLINRVATAVENAQNIIVLSGAGVSVSCGIPDFRSKGGLYDLVSREPGFDLGDAQMVFDVSEFRSNPATFFKIARHLMPSNSITPSKTHYFFACLQAKKKLRRVYSQNIDGLEHKAGVSLDQLVLCHGSFLSSTCTNPSCKASVPSSHIEPIVREGAVPYCEECQRRRHVRSKQPRQKRRKLRKGKNRGEPWVSSSDDEDNDNANDVGIMKPDIVLFGESLPSYVQTSLEVDVALGDLVLVFGTSLKVKPVSLIPDMFPPSIPQVLVNREKVGRLFQIELLGDCDVVVDALCKHLGWTIPHLSRSRI